MVRAWSDNQLRRHFILLPRTGLLITILGKLALVALLPMKIQGDHSACAKPPVDFKTKVLLWLGQARADQAKAELLSCSQPEVLPKLNGHPVLKACVFVVVKCTHIH